MLDRERLDRRVKGELPLPSPSAARFEQLVMPHLGAAYNLARWLVRDESEAEDMVQDACLKAFNALGGLRGDDGRAWLLTIVRNTCFTSLRKRRATDLTEFDERLHAGAATTPDPEMLRIKLQDEQAVHRALEQLPAEYREILVLREMEGLSYRQLAQVIDLPIGTVMSRLARARTRLQALLKGELP
jgi:RNA polymerase sigma-70 factor (ECF subfamily)